MTVDLETAIQQFLDFAGELQENLDLTAEVVQARMLQFYREVRVEDATFDEDRDMLLLQWGPFVPLVLNRPVDLRYVNDMNEFDEQFKFEEVEQRYLDFTRQIFAPEDGEAEFDDVAVQLSLTLTYGPASSNEPSENQWIHTPSEIEEGIAKFHCVPFVAQHFSLSPMRLTATVDYCG